MSSMTMTPSAEAAVDQSALREILVSGGRPQPANAFAAVIAHGWRAMLKIKHVPEQLMDVTIFPIMFTLMFTYLFGGALADSTGDYLQFLLPGTLVMTITMITIYTGIGLNNDRTKGFFDRLRTLPAWQPSAVVGMLLGDAVRYTLGATVVITLGLILGYRPEGGFIGVVLAVALVLLFSFALSWIWTALGLFMRSEKAVMNTSMTLLFPLSFASNVFVDPATMPRWLEMFVNANPLSHATTATRGLMAGDASAGEIGLVFLWSAILVAVFAPLTAYLYRR